MPIANLVININNRTKVDSKNNVLLEFRSIHVNEDPKTPMQPTTKEHRDRDIPKYKRFRVLSDEDRNFKGK